MQPRDSLTERRVAVETYRVRAGEYECGYSGMPRFGLAKASETVEAVGRLESARGRLGGGDYQDRRPPGRIWSFERR